MKRPITTRIGTNDLGIYDEVVTKDCYGLKMLSNSFTGRNIVVVDIGAHIGTFAYALTEHLRNVNTISYIAYEPYVPNYTLLEHNINFVKDFHPYCCNFFGHSINRPVSNENRVTLESVHGINTGMVVYKECKSDEFGIRTTTIPNILSAYPVIDILKSDCEGAEELFFEDIQFDKVHNFVGEYHSCGMKERLKEAFNGNNYPNKTLQIIEHPSNKHQGIFRVLSI